jgi:hypothetical protein
MIVANIFPIWSYECPICHDIHHIEKEHVSYMDTWTEKCPKSREPIRLMNWNFLDNQSFETLKSDNESTNSPKSSVDGKN